MEKWRERRRADQVVLDCSFLSVAFIVCCAKATTHKHGTIPYVTYGFLLLCYSNFVLNRTVFQIFDFKKCHDLEILVRGNLRSLNMVPFDRLCMVSYYSSIVTLSVRCTVFEIVDIKNVVTLKTGKRVREGHWKCHHSTERIRLPINVL